MLFSELSRKSKISISCTASLHIRQTTLPLKYFQLHFSLVKVHKRAVGVPSWTGVGPLAVICPLLLELLRGRRKHVAWSFLWGFNFRAHSQISGFSERVKSYIVVRWWVHLNNTTVTNLSIYLHKQSWRSKKYLVLTIDIKSEKLYINIYVAELYLFSHPRSEALSHSIYFFPDHLRCGRSDCFAFYLCAAL